MYIMNNHDNQVMKVEKLLNNLRCLYDSKENKYRWLNGNCAPAIGAKKPGEIWRRLRLRFHSQIDMKEPGNSRDPFIGVER